MNNNNEETIQEINENSIERKKTVIDAANYSDLTLVELKFEEMNREVIRIREIVQSVKEQMTPLVNAINKLAGLVEAPTVSIDSLTKNIDMQLEAIENFVNEQISRYTEINEFTSEQIDKLIHLFDELFDEDGQLITYEVNGEKVTENFTTLLRNKEREERIKSGESLINMIVGFEGSTPVVGDKYMVTVDPGNKQLLAVGNGILLGSNAKVFADHGIDVNNIKYGDLLDISVVNAVRDDIISNTKSQVLDILDANNITLNDCQIDALTSRMYNTGNINRFVEMYNRYGDTQELYDNWMQYPVYGQNGEYFSTLADRRQKEWNLFHNSIYPDEQ